MKRSYWSESVTKRLEKKILKERGTLDAECPTCGTTFKMVNLQHKYCSHICRPSSNSKMGKWTILHRDNFRCIYCGRAPWNTENLIMHVDHIVPQCEGGDSRPHNLVTSCSECNSTKRNIQLKNKKEIIKIVEQRNIETEINPKITIKF
ncbi:MAG: hypothetical protein CMF52_03175 [Legionellales bacterium]|nr:hypothetical protein [Legionellales bacterium]